MMTKPTRSPKFAAALLAAFLLGSGLTACSRDAPDRASENIVQEQDDLPAQPTPTPSPERAALPAPDAAIQTNAMDELTEEAPAEPDEQMMDDAAASGMTARASREDPSPRQAPAEVEERR